MFGSLSCSASSLSVGGIMLTTLSMLPLLLRVLVGRCGGETVLAKRVELHAGLPVDRVEQLEGCDLGELLARLVEQPEASLARLWLRSLSPADVQAVRVEHAHGAAWLCALWQLSACDEVDLERGDPPVRVVLARRPFLRHMLEPDDVSAYHRVGLTRVRDHLVLGQLCNRSL